MTNAERTWVLLHGSPGDSTSWDPLRAHAPAGVSLEAWDLLDHGRAADAPSATLDDVVADVVGRVEALGRPVTLVGHSFGSWVAARACAALGERVLRFVSIAGLAGITDEIAARSMGFAAALESGGLSLAAAADAAVDLWLPTVGRNADDVARLRAMITADRVERLVRILRRQCGLADSSLHVRSLRVPTVGVGCRDDRGISLALGRELAEMAAIPTFIELDGDSHFPHWTHTAPVAALVFA